MRPARVPCLPRHLPHSEPQAGASLLRCSRLPVHFLAKTKKTNTLAYCKFLIISLVRVRSKPHCHSPHASDGCTETALIVLTVLCAREFLAV